MERKSNPKDFVDTIKSRPVKERPQETLFPSGSTLLNCALTDTIYGGFGSGKICNVIGESSAGKTMLAETCLAEIANNPIYDDYILILDDAEQALEMDIEGLFGKKAAARIQAPMYSSDGSPIYSDTVEQWFANVMRLIKEEKPFVYFLDSLDTLTVASEYAAADDLIKKSDKGEEVVFEGSYGLDKAKKMSQILRTIKGGLANTNSTLIVISQTRDNINAMPGQAKKVRSGGKGQQFYYSHVVWLASIKKLKAGKKGKELVIGSTVEAKVAKNKMSGKERAVRFNVYYSYGVDDIDSCIEFLCEEDVFAKRGAFIDASALLGDDSKLVKKSDLLAHIEADKSKEDQLKQLVQKAWSDREAVLVLDRKPRFA